MQQPRAVADTLAERDPLEATLQGCSCSRSLRRRCDDCRVLPSVATKFDSSRCERQLNIIERDAFFDSFTASRVARSFAEVQRTAGQRPALGVVAIAAMVQQQRTAHHEGQTSRAVCAVMHRATVTLHEHGTDRCSEAGGSHDGYPRQQQAGTASTRGRPPSTPPGVEVAGRASVGERDLDAAACYVESARRVTEYALGFNDAGSQREAAAVRSKLASRVGEASQRRV